MKPPWLLSTLVQVSPHPALVAIAFCRILPKSLQADESFAEGFLQEFWQTLSPAIHAQTAEQALAAAFLEQYFVLAGDWEAMERKLTERFIAKNELSAQEVEEFVAATVRGAERALKYSTAFKRHITEGHAP